MLIGCCAADLSHKKAAATATGFVGCFAYIGAAVAGYPLGVILQNWGWEGFFVLIGGCSVLTIFMLIPIWSARAVTTSDQQNNADHDNDTMESSA